MNIDIVSFQDQYIEEASAPLAERRRRDRLRARFCATVCQIRRRDV
ncbi:MAG: hypothetical protein V9H69_19100 [Anaerolineae bacterium]|jgi:hypothetical protein